MTRESILRKALDMASHNLYCCSANLVMTKPKEGSEEQHKAYAEEVKVLEEWIAELAATPARLRTDRKEPEQPIVYSEEEIARMSVGTLAMLMDHHPEVEAALRRM